MGHELCLGVPSWICFKEPMRMRGYWVERDEESKQRQIRSHRVGLRVGWG